MILALLLALLRGNYVPPVLGLDGIYLSAFVGFTVVCPLTYLVLKKYSWNSKPVWILLTIMLGLSILELPVRIADFRSSLITLGTLLMWWFGALCGYCIFKIKNLPVKIIVAAVALAFTVWFSYDGYERWVKHIVYGKVQKMPFPEISIQNDNNENISITEFRGKYVLLDFWSSACGNCFRKFPEVQQVYDKFKDADNIVFYAVFCRFEDQLETPKTGSEILTEYGYTFPSISVKWGDPILKDIGVDGVPTVIILDPDGNLVFRGDILDAELYLEKNTESGKIK